MKKLTRILFILDRSGSMSNLKEDTIGGFNSLIDKQKQEEGNAIVSTILFDDHYEVLHEDLDLHKVPILTEKEYYPRGTTALLDAIGRTIITYRNKDKNQGDYALANTLVVITTDGLENASREYTYQDIKTLIKKQEEIYEWEFLFLGANIDAVKEGQKFGIRKERTANFHADKLGIEAQYETLNKTLKNYRQSSRIMEDWNKDVETDFQQRKKGE